MPLTENFDILPTNVEYPHFDVYKSPAYETLYIHHVSTAFPSNFNKKEMFPRKSLYLYL